MYVAVFTGFSTQWPHCFPFCLLCLCRVAFYLAPSLDVRTDTWVDGLAALPLQEWCFLLPLPCFPRTVAAQKNHTELSGSCVAPLFRSWLREARDPELLFLASPSEDSHGLACLLSVPVDIPAQPSPSCSQRGSWGPGCALLVASDAAGQLSKQEVTLQAHHGAGAQLPCRSQQVGCLPVILAVRTQRQEDLLSPGVQGLRGQHRDRVSECLSVSWIGVSQTLVNFAV